MSRVDKIKIRKIFEEINLLPAWMIGTANNKQTIRVINFERVNLNYEIQ